MGLHQTFILILVIFILDFSFGLDNDVEAFNNYDPSESQARLKTQKDNDNHKPTFTECSNYTPSIKEEQPRGTYVIDVQATDNDPPENGGTITYTIIKREGDRSYFKIDNVTGRIETNLAHDIDRDEPTRLKEIYITVQATDNGRPALSDICTFKVTVTDINDNSPSFDKFEYEEKVSEEAKIGREVMRVVAYDIDFGDNARLTYSLRTDDSESSKEFEKYFKIDPLTGVLYLKESLSNKRGAVFASTVVVQDNPSNPAERKESTASIKTTVVGSDKRPPAFTSQTPEYLEPIPENYNDYTNPLVTLEAKSNIEDPDVIFELIKGQTTQTNKDSTFVLEPVGTKAYIKLGRALDYETVTNYQLTVRCTNKDSWSVITTIDIEIKDVNDEIPTFIEQVSGSVLENEKEGAEVMQVRAVDKDGTSENNIVSYELEDHQDFFAIDSKTGKVTTKVPFDRETQSVYNVKIKAKDNNKSTLTGKPYNSASQSFRITIEDRNDNPPQFTKSEYVAERIPENSDIGKEVIEVKANDKDTASLIEYRIIDGNTENAFMIESTTGRIKVNAKLDFETIENYILKIEASDGIFKDVASVHIEIQNVNDELPRFEDYNKNISILEETIPPDCIITLKAYDPDIKNRSAPQNIVYRVGDEQKDFLSVNEEGCVKLIKKLDRDKPDGSPFYQAFILAYDEGDSPNSINKEAELFIMLDDINDNAPFLNMTEVVWYENLDPGKIATLKADDYDGPNNGPPFTYRISPNAGEEIKFNFEIQGDALFARERFDREFKKFYDIPIEITDAGEPSQIGVSILRCIIGDENDNAAKDGESSIFVYNYQGFPNNGYPDIEIGRVYVEDPDDWDLNDKVFVYKHAHPQFDLNSDNGSIIMKQGTPAGVYELFFLVNETNYPLIPSHTVEAKVTVTVKDIPEEAIRKSGSIRVAGATIESLVEKNENGVSKVDILHNYIAKILNTSKDNVDVFTVLKSPSNDSLVDIRFSAHGSPYYSPEKLNYKVSSHQKELERDLDVKFVMISINECMLETTCTSSCTNELNIKNEPAVVFTNRTSFVGVNAIVEANCKCIVTEVTGCYNDGVSIEDSRLCTCSEGFEGPHCEILGIGFTGDGYAMYPAFETCAESDISLEVESRTEDGLIFYLGPMSLYPMPLAPDFLSLELKDGYLILLINYGSGTAEVPYRHKKLTPGTTHSIRIKLKPKEIWINVDDCVGSDCFEWKNSVGENKLLNVNGPLQVGGIQADISVIANALKWDQKPTDVGFNGCVRNLTYNGFVYNLGEPGFHYNANANCNYGLAKAVSFGIDSNFLVAILVCIAILLILLLAVVVHKRKQDNWGEKDNDDIRETIISYEDEGGGEVDTGFDLEVLRRVRDDGYPMKDKAPEVPDISGFLDHKKETCDKDANNYPFDDVRYYAYEGDGNSTGSLSSLASCTDDGDLKFNYLSSFGPRFRKLADMYGEDPSDEDSQDGGEESWC